jgi:hypothetical protein
MNMPGIGRVAVLSRVQELYRKPLKLAEWYRPITEMQLHKWLHKSTTQLKDWVHHNFHQKSLWATYFEASIHKGIYNLKRSAYLPTIGDWTVSYEDR